VSKLNSRNRERAPSKHRRVPLEDPAGGTGHGANADANGDHSELIDVLPNGVP